MNINLLFLLIITFILITFILIFIILFNHKKIEKLTVKEQLPPLNIPPLVTNGDITILYKVLPEVAIGESATIYNARTMNSVNIREKYDITDPVNIANSLKGYGIYYIQSSFIPSGPVNENNNNIAGLLKGNNNNNSIRLYSPNLYKEANTINWISIRYPEKFQFMTIKITARPNTNITHGNISYNKISIGSVNTTTGSAFRINPGTRVEDIINGDVITFTYSVTTPIVIDNLYIIFASSEKIVILTKIEILGYQLNSDIYEDITISEEVVKDDSISVFTDNENSKFASIDSGLSRSATQQEESLNTYEQISTADKFRVLLANNGIPWAAYSASQITNGFLSDLYNRECKKAIVSGNCIISSDRIPNTNKNISYLKGDITARITFPEGSLPTNYTICVISKYTNPQVNRGRILTTDSQTNPNWLLGHWGNQAGGVSYSYDSWVYNNEKYDNKDTKWTVSCIKSRARNTKYSLIVDDVPRAFKIAGPNTINPNARLAINSSTGYPNELSEFGLAYLLIWNYALSDNELLIISQTLTKYITTGEEIPLNISITNDISLNYGRTIDNPGLSAMDIKLKSCTNEDGIYWIKDPTYNNTAKPIYCIMDSAFDGGGWMLAMKGSPTNTKFAYNGKDENNNNYWTSDNTYNEYDMDTTFNNDAKYNIFNYYPVKKCMAIFNVGENTNNITYKYGWRWIEDIQSNNISSLREYFREDKSTFIYYSSGNYDLLNETNYARHFTNSFRNTSIKKYSNKQEFDSIVIDRFYSTRYWSRQETFKSYGFNITNKGHKVRWGCVFNQDGGGVPDSCDVSGGIGLSNREWGAGNSPSSWGNGSTWENEPKTDIRQMAFKWFIK